MRALEYVYDYDRGSAGPAGVSGLRDLVGEDQAADSAAELQRRGWIRRDQRMSAGYHMTAAGRSEVQALRARRSDRAHRRSMCREDLLRWVDAQTTPDPGRRVSREKFDGSVDLLDYSEEEVRAAATFLADRKLVKSISAAGAPHIALWITESGQECIDEGGIEVYLRSREEGVGQPVGIVNNFNMAGTGNVFATATAAGAVANATLNNFNLDHARLLARAVRLAASDLDLTDVETEALAEIETPDVEPARAQRAVGLLTTFLMGTSTGTLGQVLGMLGASALGITA
ncbi:hypothetical protein FBY23_0343 [Nocardioides sp. SLBN-35]|nr:hypothetical protein FBY23_0343 [Nocardioides sp. SLBN-35]